MDGATYYKVYYDQFQDECEIDQDSGRPDPCELLETNISGTTYTHTFPNHFANFYWVVSCNDDGCSPIPSESAAPTTG